MEDKCHLETLPAAILDPDVSKSSRVEIPASQLAVRALAKPSCLPDRGFVPGRHNLRMRDHTRPVGEEALAAATIIRVENGLSLETPFGGLAFESGGFVSMRSGHMQHFRGEAHLDMLRLLEVTPAAGRIFSESLMIRWFHEGEHHEYLADYHWEFAPGVIGGVGEIKRDVHDLDDARYMRKLSQLAELLRMCGIAFRLTFEHEIFKNRLHRRNVKRFCMRRFTQVSRSHSDRLRNFKTKQGQMTTFGRLAEVIDPWPVRGEAVIQALLIRDRVALDLTRRVTPDTGVFIK